MPDLGVRRVIQREERWEAKKRDKRKTTSREAGWWKRAKGCKRPPRSSQGERSTDGGLAASDTISARTGKAFVMASDQVGFDLLDGIESDADDDEKGGTAEVERDTVLCDQKVGKDANDRDVESAAKGDPREDEVDVLGRLLSGADSGDVASGFFDIVSHVDGVEGDGGVEVTKEDDQEDVDKVVKQTVVAEVVG